MLTCLLACASDPVRTQIDMPTGSELKSGQLVDLNLDGQRDLVLIAWTPARRRARELRAHFARDTQADSGRFSSEPDLFLELPQDVIAVSFADVHPDAGREVLLTGPRAVFLWRPHAPDEASRVQLFCQHESLWQIPDHQEALLGANTVVDLDGNGLEDLLLPEAGGWRVVHQELVDQERRFDPETRLRLPIDAEREDARARFGREGRDEASGVVTESNSDGTEVSLGLGSQDGWPTTLASASQSLPALQAHDFDGDGDLDLMALTRWELWVWIQESAGTWTPAPSQRFPSPVERDDARRFDVSFSAHAGMFDGDPKVDVVFVAGDKRSKDARTQVLLFDQKEGSLFGERGVPSSLVVIPGYAGDPSLVDLDGDGSRDFVATVFRPDALDAVRSAASGRIDLELRAYRNQDGQLGRKPVLQEQLSLDVEAEEAGYFARFIGDVNGDGSSDLLLRESPGRLVIRTLKRKGNGFVLDTKDLAATEIHEEAVLVLPARDSLEGLEVLALHDGGLVHWSLLRGQSR